MNGQSLRTRAVSGVAWVAGTRAIGQAVTWAITLFVVRLLAPQDYGLMGLATLFIGFLLLFNELGLGAAIVQKAELNTEHLRDLRWAILAANLTLCLLIVLSAPWVAGYFNEPKLTPIVRVLAAIFVIQGVGVPSACMLQRELRFKQKSQAELLGNVTGALTTLACAAGGLGVWSLVAGYLLQQVTTNALYCAHYPVPVGTTFSLGNVKPFVQFGAHLTSARVLWYISSNADTVVVGRMLGATQLGYYGLAFQLSSLPTDKIMSIVTQVAFPSFSSLQNDPETLKRSYLKLVNFVALATFPLFLGLFVVAEAAIPLLLTSKWAPVILPLKILSLMACTKAVGSINTPLLMAKNRTGIILFNHVLQVLVLPVGFYVGAGWGLNGVVFAWLILWPFLFAVAMKLTLDVLQLTVGHYLNALKHAAIGTVIMVGLLSILQATVMASWPPAYEVSLTCVLGALVYVSYQWLFNRASIAEMLAVVRPRRDASAGVSAPVAGRVGDAGVALSSSPNAATLVAKTE